MNYRICRIYTEPHNQAKYFEVLSECNWFFLTSLQGRFIAAIITPFGLYEARLESIGVVACSKNYPARACAVGSSGRSMRRLALHEEQRRNRVSAR